jgi:PAS domain S-box-containing protein
MITKHKSSLVMLSKHDRQEKRSELPRERLWERIFNSVPDLIAVLDREHRIVLVNRPMAEKLKVASEDCVGLLCHECVHGRPRPIHDCPHRLTLADGKEHVCEVREERLGGTYLVTTSPLRDEHDEVVGSVHVARDITKQKEAEEHLRRQLEAEEHERQLIGCEIHDHLAQQLAGAIMQLGAFEALREKCQAQADEALRAGLRLLHGAHDEARRLIHGLRPPQLGEKGIIAALKELIAESNAQQDMRIAFRSNVERLRMDPGAEHSVFRIVQEGISNACRHSQSKRATVTLSRRHDRLQIRIRDWGVGFDISHVAKGHFGLEGICERARVFGGRAEITSVPQKGTVIVAEFPLRSHDNHPVAARPRRRRRVAARA